MAMGSKVASLNSCRPSTVELKYLTEDQQIAFDKLKQLCKEHNKLWPQSEAASTQGIADDHDIALLRYLRARSFDVQAAFQQYSATADWRESKCVDSVYDNATISLFETTRRLFPQWSGRRDKQGFPVFVYVVADVQTKDLAEMARQDPELTSIVLPAEVATSFYMPLCATLHPDGIVDRGVNIIDLSGVSLRQFWTLRNHLQRASNMATSHYPETVDRMFIVGAPSYFPTVWGFITKWFDPSTTSKIHILPEAEVFSTLEQYIDRKNIPERFGGDLQWSYGRPPSFDPEFRPFIGELIDDWTPGPLRFMSNVAGGQVLAVGTAENGERRREILQKKTTSMIEVDFNDEKSHTIINMPAKISAAY